MCHVGDSRAYRWRAGTLEQLAALAAATRDLVLRRADRLFATAGRFHRHQVAITCRDDGADHLVLGEVDLDEDDAATRT